LFGFTVMTGGVGETAVASGALARDARPSPPRRGTAASGILLRLIMSPMVREL
jgi:hypothetical protein